MSAFIRWVIHRFHTVHTRPTRHARERFLLPIEWHRLKAVLDEQPPKIRIYFYLLVLEGPRMSEARTMQRNHVDLAAGLWHKPTTKSGRSQILALSPQTCALLAQLTCSGCYLFPGESNEQPWSRTAVQYHWRKIRRLAQLSDVQIRDLRRTCASWLTMQGESLMVVKDILHHSSVATTQIYARLDQRAVRAALTRHAERILAT